MLRVANLSVAIGPIPIIRDASLALDEGEMCGLIGRNGAGKTTLIRALMGALPATGKAALDDVDLLALPAHARVGHGIGYMPEDRRLIPDLTVEENVLVPAWAAGVKDAPERLKKIYHFIPELAAFAPRKGLQLSGGQQKLAALGRALVCGTRFLVLDEPFEGVAPALAHRLVEVIAGLKKEGLTVLVSESDLQHSERMVDRIYTIDRGSVAEGNA